MPDTRQDADQRVRIPAHWPDTFHSYTDLCSFESCVMAVAGIAPSISGAAAGQDERDRDGHSGGEEAERGDGGYGGREDPGDGAGRQVGACLDSSEQAERRA